MGIDIYNRRRWAPILVVWGIAIIIVLALLWWAWVMPAIADLFTPFYVAIAVIVAAVTWKWFRERHRGSDRRHTDRRRSDRRQSRDTPPAV